MDDQDIIVDDHQSETRLSLGTLVEKIKRGSVVPVIGGDLCALSKVNEKPSDDGVFLYDLLAQKLLEKLAPKQREQLNGQKLHVVANQLIRNFDVHTELNDLHADLLGGRFPPFTMDYACFVKLAKIKHFKIFLTVTFSDALERCLKEEYGEKGVTIIDFSLSKISQGKSSPVRVRDLDKGVVVINLLGSIKNYREFAITEEEYLEYFFHIISGVSGMFNVNTDLLNRLRESSFLYLGCGFPDWYARYIVRGLTQKRYLDHRFPNNIFVDGAAAYTPVEKRFFTQFHAHFLDDIRIEDIFSDLRPGLVVKGKNAALTFVNTVYNAVQESDLVGHIAPTRGIRWKYQGKVFVCYFNEDKAEAEIIYDRLVSMGIESWIDKVELPAGAHRPEIQDKIAECGVFLPVVSTKLIRRMDEIDEHNLLEKNKPGGEKMEYPYCVSEEWKHILARKSVNEYHKKRNQLNKVSPFVITTCVLDGVSDRHYSIPSEFKDEHIYTYPLEEKKLIQDIENFLSNLEKR